MKKLIIGFLLFASPCYADARSSIRPLWFMGRQICTASSINERMGLWLTAQHCVSAGAPQVGDSSDPDHPLHVTTIVWVSEPADLAVLFTATLRVHALTLAPEPVTVGEFVQSVGYPMALAVPQYVQGYVSAYATPVDVENVTHTYDMFGMNVCGGASGSPILNGAGEIVSITQIAANLPCSSITGGAQFSALQRYVTRFFEA